MKIQEVTIEGYQSHTNSTFRLSPGLTVITGPSDAGKTAIIRALSCEAAGRYVEKCNRELEEAQEELQAAWEAAGGVCPLCGSEVKENCIH